jgi:hypothetical protein
MCRWLPREYEAPELLFSVFHVRVDVVDLSDLALPVRVYQFILVPSLLPRFVERVHEVEQLLLLTLLGINFLLHCLFLIIHDWWFVLDSVEAFKCLSVFTNIVNPPTQSLMYLASYFQETFKGQPESLNLSIFRWRPVRVTYVKVPAHHI